MTKWLKTEFRRANKEKKRCKKLYSDWKDDEFNCGANKFIFGVVNENCSQQSEASFHTLNDLVVYYNRDTEKYLLDIEPIVENSIEYLSNLLKKFRNFVCETYNIQNLNIGINPSLYTYLYDMSNYWSSDNLVDLYFRFYIFVQGYKQLCKIKKQSDEKQYGGEN